MKHFERRNIIRAYIIFAAQRVINVIHSKDSQKLSDKCEKVKFIHPLWRTKLYENKTPVSVFVDEKYGYRKRVK